MYMNRLVCWWHLWLNEKGICIVKPACLADMTCIYTIKFVRLPVLVSLESGGTGDSVCVCICNGLHRFIPVLYKLTLCIMLHLHFVLDRKMVTMT